MLEFMDYVQHSFYKVSHWNTENSYSQLTATARGKQTANPKPAYYYPSVISNIHPL